MYVAQRELMVRQPDGTSAVIAPGDEVKGFEAWPLWQRNVHLQQELVVNTQGPLLADRLVVPTAPATRPSLVSTARKTQDAEIEHALADNPPLDAGVASVDGTSDDEALTCTQCQKGPFKSEHGLRLHVGKAHA